VSKATFTVTPPRLGVKHGPCEYDFGPKGKCGELGALCKAKGYDKTTRDSQYPYKATKHVVISAGAKNFKKIFLCPLHAAFVADALGEGNFLPPVYEEA
jgi:hypothetical protein